MRERSYMKSQIFVVLIVVAIHSIIPSCSFHESDAYIPPVTGVVFTSSDEAWVLTRKGILKRISTDGQSITVVDAQQRVQGMSFISPSQGWTVDSDWNVWHFDGVGWTFVGHNDDDDNKFGLVWPSSVSFADEKVGWARTLEPLFLTDDGGRTWQKVLVTEPGEFIRLSVIDRDTAFLYSENGSVRRTTDRGKTWRVVLLGAGYPGSVTSLACRNGVSGECWAGTATGELFAISKDSAATRMPLPQTFGHIGIFSISFGGTSGSSFVAGGTYGEHPVGLLLRTDDGGQTWNKVEVPHVEARHDDRFEHVASFGSTIWLASDTAIYRSSDGGVSWAKVYDANN